MKRLTTIAAATLVATCLMATPQSAAASIWGNIINAIWKQWYAVYGDNQVVFVHNNTDRIAMFEVRRGDGTSVKASTRHFTLRKERCTHAIDPIAPFPWFATS